MKNPNRYTSYKDFFPYYLREHSKRSTRILHYIGTGLGQTILWVSILTQSWIFIPLAFICGYAFAWTAHFFIEKNKPATFEYPWWSQIGDHHMTFLMLTGKLKKSLENAGVKS
tara:strand:- start:139 stop:477 length:339 start_codon:yes stop_codon:yes gene_type:complete